MAAIIKFQHVEVGQLLSQVSQVIRKNCITDIFVKITAEQNNKSVCRCGISWNAININALGSFKVHFCEHVDVVINPCADRWHQISEKIK